MAWWDNFVQGAGDTASGAWDWTKSNPLGALAGGMDLFKLIGAINSQVQAQNQQSQLQQLMNRGPRVQDWYQPMTAAEQQGYTRGVGANLQQNIPPQSAAFSDLLGQALANRESQRFYTSGQMAQQDWQNRLQSKGGLQQQAFGGGLVGSQPGQALAQYLLYRQLMNARQGAQQTGQTADPSQLGQLYNYPSVPPGTFVNSSLQAPGGGAGSGGAGPYASGEFTPTTGLDSWYSERGGAQ